MIRALRRPFEDLYARQVAQGYSIPELRTYSNATHLLRCDEAYESLMAHSNGGAPFRVNERFFRRVWHYAEVEFGPFRLYPKRLLLPNRRFMSAIADSYSLSFPSLFGRLGTPIRGFLVHNGNEELTYLAIQFRSDQSGEWIPDLTSTLVDTGHNFDASEEQVFHPVFASAPELTEDDLIDKQFLMRRNDADDRNTQKTNAAAKKVHSGATD